jgi:hypothetical protein
MSYGLGGKPHRKDERDYLLRAVPRERLPEVGTSTARWWAMHAPEFRIDQGNEGTCVGHGVTNYLAGAPKQHLSFPSFADVNAAHLFAKNLYLEITGDLTYQQGAYTRDALDWCLAKGYASAYYRLADTDEIIDTLLNLGPVIFASPWFDSMFSPAFPSWSSNAYLNVNPDSGLAGYHLYVLNGIDLAPDTGDRFVRMWTSWGHWGKNGTARIYVDDLPILYDGDAYVLTEEAF